MVWKYQTGVASAALLTDSESRELAEVGEQLIRHLDQELEFLNDVISDAHQLGQLINRSSQLNSNPASLRLPSSNSDEVSSDILLRHDAFNRRLNQIGIERRQVHEILEKLAKREPPILSLSELSDLLPLDVRERLNQLRSEVKRQIQNLQTILVGNQVLLGYSIDFYQRIVQGLSGAKPSSQSYDANGKTTANFSNPIVQTRC